MDSTFLNKILLQASLLLGQFTHPAVPENPIFSIKVTLSDVETNLNTSRPFRGLMLKNTAQNLYYTGTALRNKEYRKASESALFAVFSALTACFYPENDSWGSCYKKKMSNEQLLIMSAICIVSCGNATFNPVFKNSEPLSLAEKLISTGICAMPFFYSFQHFGFNINK